MRSSTYDWTGLGLAIRRVFANPFILGGSLLWGFLMLGIVLWLPNIELVRIILANDTLSAWAKVRLVLDIYQLLFAALGYIQLLIMIVFTALSCVGFGLFWFVIHQLKNGRTSAEQANHMLLTAVLGIGITMMGITLLTPVVTISGLIFGTNLHLAGILISLGGLGLATWANLKLVEIIKENPTSLLEPISK